jgi:ferric-dicitrate binding protein FerR (iron transport regulator)
MTATRTFVAPSRKARRANILRTAAVIGAAVGFLIVVFVLVGGGGNSDTKLTARPLTAKVLSPTVKFRTSSGATLTELQSSDKLNEKAVIETDATGLGEFEYADHSIVRVGPSSNFSFTKARSEGSKRDIANRLVTGKAWNRVTPGFGESSNYQATVLGATGTVVGTSFAVVCPSETDCFYTLVKGRMRIEDSANHTADLKAGDQVEVKFGRLDPVKHLTDAELAGDSWITQNLNLDGDTTTPTSEETTTSVTGETTTSITLPGQTTLPGAATTSRSGTTRIIPVPPPPPPPPPPAATTTPATTATTSPATTAPPTTAGPTTTRFCDRRPKPAQCP